MKLNSARDPIRTAGQEFMRERGAPSEENVNTEKGKKKEKRGKEREKRKK